jgi:hypothetical protein
LPIVKPPKESTILRFPIFERLVPAAMVVMLFDVLFNVNDPAPASDKPFAVMGCVCVSVVLASIVILLFVAVKFVAILTLPPLKLIGPAILSDLPV